MRAALRARMAKRYDELDAWQLANELKLGVYRLIETGTVTRTCPLKGARQHLQTPLTSDVQRAGRCIQMCGLVAIVCSR